MTAGSLLRGALTRLLGGRRPTSGGRGDSGDAAQLTLDFAAPPPAPALAPATPSTATTPAVAPPRAPSPGPGRTGNERASAAAAAAARLLERLRALGLRDGDGGIERLRLTRNRTVMVSFRRGELRVHRGYLEAPDDVLRAIVAFVQARTRRQRAAAQRVILAHPAAASAGGLDDPRLARRPRARERTLPDDEPMVRVLDDWHRRFNDDHFGGALGGIPIRVSRRLKSRLGHYTAATADGLPAEIVISRAHIRRHGFEEALHTLLHEMVHQWQDESGHALDHGRDFRRKAREVGITAAARRDVAGRGGAPRSVEQSRRRAAG